MGQHISLVGHPSWMKEHYVTEHGVVRELVLQ
jgi:hypothetical protein